MHVTADAVHEQIAQHDLVASMLDTEPGAAGMILFGARALVEIEGRFAGQLFEAWDRGRTSLRVPLGRGYSGAAEVIRDPTPTLNALVRVTPPASLG